uniref:Uncharacterized protein n=1 Tax=Saimiri boliviensis boliviensis TaxID=39432 RepID=A0A2K6S6Z2_SAIBB
MGHAVPPVAMEGADATEFSIVILPHGPGPGLYLKQLCSSCQSQSTRRLGPGGSQLQCGDTSSSPPCLMPPPAPCPRSRPEPCPLGAAGDGQKTTESHAQVSSRAQDRRVPQPRSPQTDVTSGSHISGHRTGLTWEKCFGHGQSGYVAK